MRLFIFHNNIDQDLGFLWSHETRGSRIRWDLRGSYFSLGLVAWSSLFGRPSRVILNCTLIWNEHFFPHFTLSSNLTNAHQPRHSLRGGKGATAEEKQTKTRPESPMIPRAKKSESKKIQGSIEIEDIINYRSSTWHILKN